MLKFFRRIRQKLLDEGRLRKYLVYAIGEILLVMIGILLALQVNNWNERRLVEIEEKESLNQIMEGLKAELNTYSYYEDYFSPKKAYLSQVSEGKLEGVSLDSFVININNYYDHRTYNSAYIGLKSGGKLGIIQNKDLRQGIIFFYELRSDLLQSWSEWHEGFVNTHIESYVLTELEIDPNYVVKDVKKLEEEIKNKKVISLVNYQLKAMDEILNRMSSNEQYVQDLIGKIETELSNRW